MFFLCWKNQSWNLLHSIQEKDKQREDLDSLSWISFPCFFYLSTSDSNLVRINYQ
jgi:hypothetical protein